MHTKITKKIITSGDPYKPKEPEVHSIIYLGAEYMKAWSPSAGLENGKIIRISHLEMMFEWSLVTILQLLRKF